MEYAYSIIMGIFSGMMLLYAGLMALSKDYKMLPLRVRQSVKPKNEKKYMLQLSKVIALTAVGPALSALVGLLNAGAAFAVLIVSEIILIWLGTRFMRGVD